jgi:hypothetical protein
MLQQLWSVRSRQLGVSDDSVRITLTRPIRQPLKPPGFGYSVGWIGLYIDRLQDLDGSGIAKQVINIVFLCQEAVIARIDSFWIREPGITDFLRVPKVNMGINDLHRHALLQVNE